MAHLGVNDGHYQQQWSLPTTEMTSGEGYVIVTWLGSLRGQWVNDGHYQEQWSLPTREKTSVKGYVIVTWLT